MLNKKEKFSLFFSSYIPLWIILIIKLAFLIENSETQNNILFKELFTLKKVDLKYIVFNFKNEFKMNLKLVFIMILFIIVVISFFQIKMLLKAKRGKSSELKIKRVKSLPIDYLTNYFSLYLFPFFALSGSDTVNMIILFLIIIIAAIIYIGNDIIYINPIILLMGYRVFIIEIIQAGDENIEVFLLTSCKRNEISKILKAPYKFEKDFYFYPKEKK